MNTEQLRLYELFKEQGHIQTEAPKRLGHHLFYLSFTDVRTYDVKGFLIWVYLKRKDQEPKFSLPLQVMYKAREIVDVTENKVIKSLSGDSGQVVLLDNSREVDSFSEIEGEIGEALVWRPSSRDRGIIPSNVTSM